MSRPLVTALCAALIGASGCAASQQGAGTLPSQALSAGSDEPALYLTSAADSPILGFLGGDVLLDVLGPREADRVPVRIRGAMQVRAYVPASQLQLRTQRHGRLRGTPLYLGPNDAALVIGKGEKADRVRVRATPRVGSLTLPAFEGTYPVVGLAAHPAPADAAVPPTGTPHVLPVQTPLELRDKPAGKVVAQLAPQSEPIAVSVLQEQNGWRAVRVGEGPFLVGYTNGTLTPGQLPTPPAPRESSAGGPPKRLLDESGELQQLAQGAKVSFDGRVIARLDKPGYARVLATYPSGQADALVAIDDTVAVRGLVQTKDLSKPSIAAR